jgi:mRNA-degrading endonuclease RelE of RelBE toxin-antitoxin system
MSYEILTIKPFERQLKRLVKKYPSLKSEFIALIDVIRENPETGVSIGNGCFKIRMSVASKGKGKSGGARVITNVYIEEKVVYLLSIYDKSEQSNISDRTIEELLKLI